MRAHVAHPLRLHDLIRGTRHVLIAWMEGPAERDRLEALAAEIAAAHGDLVRVVAVAPTTVAADDAPVGVPVHHDAGGRFAAAYAPTPGAGWLVRPDGHVGLIGRPLAAAAVAGYFAAFG